MKTHILPLQFDGLKFSSRYSLSPTDGSFFVGGDGLLHYPDSLPDEPIFDLPDSPLTVLRNFALALVDQALPDSELLRAVLLTIFDELNLHALKINQILDAVDAATTLADLKTRVAAIPDYPQRTVAQAKAAVKSKISGGGAD